jgi:ATP-dependent DNA helicase RecQ
VDTWDGSVAAQKVLSCVYRTGQRFGAEHLTQVLLGIDNEKIRKFGHHQVSTFGIGRELSQKEWKTVIRQLVATGLLLPHPDGKGGFCLSPQSREVLKGEKQVFFRKDPVPVHTPPRMMSKSSVAEIEIKNPIVRELWDKLRALRTKTARLLDIPPYVVFHDATLKAMIRAMPQTLEEMVRLHGIGRKKCDQYGESFLSVICRHIKIHGRSEPPPIQETSSQTTELSGNSHTPTLQETLELFEQGLSPEVIAQKRKLSLSTINNHLAGLIELRQLMVHDVSQSTG